MSKQFDVLVADEASCLLQLLPVLSFYGEEVLFSTLLGRFLTRNERVDEGTKEKKVVKVRVPLPPWHSSRDV